LLVEVVVTGEELCQVNSACTLTYLLLLTYKVCDTHSFVYKHAKLCQWLFG